MRRISYLGKVYGDEKSKAIAGCDIFVFPTFYENECFPLVLLDAMQQGKPIVTSDEGGIPDIINDNINGFITSIDTPNSVAAAIENLLNNSELGIKMGKRGYYIFSDKFSIETFEKTILNIFESV